jgi:hypothetical protein
MKSGVFKIVTVGGVEIKAHWSWLLILLLFTYQLASFYFPNALPGESEIV